MNFSAADSLQLQPPQPPQPHRPSTSCDVHPGETFTGFCPSCLCERLKGLDQSSASASTSRRPPAGALRSFFRSSAGSAANTRSYFSELRRTKSFSASKNEFLSGVLEPRRRSCDVRSRNTLWHLFSKDEERQVTKKEHCAQETVSEPVPTSVDANREEEIGRNTADSDERLDVGVTHETMRTQEEQTLPPRTSNALPMEEILEEGEAVTEHLEEEGAAMEQAERDLQCKKASGREIKDIAGSFWSAASVFSKKLQKWRQKQKLKKHKRVGSGTGALQVEKPVLQRGRGEAQSETADYGFGRRSCDVDRRYSVDAVGGFSLEDPRFSMDEPRASWDGYLIGKQLSKVPPMLALVEDSCVHMVPRSDSLIPTEESHLAFVNEEDDNVPGGSAQTREYYSESSSRRRRSVDKNGSSRKLVPPVIVAEADELMHLKISPTRATTHDRDARHSNSSSLRNDCLETVEAGSHRDLPSSISRNAERKGWKKPSGWNKALSILGIRKHVPREDEEDDRCHGSNSVGRSFSQSWQDLIRDNNRVETRGSVNPNVLRSNSTMSWRNPQPRGIGFHSGNNLMSNYTRDTNRCRKKNDKLTLDRNGSARVSVNKLDNGIFRLYTAAADGGKSKRSNPQSAARSLWRIY